MGIDTEFELSLTFSRVDLTRASSQGPFAHPGFNCYFYITSHSQLTLFYLLSCIDWYFHLNSFQPIRTCFRFFTDMFLFLTLVSLIIFHFRSVIDKMIKNGFKLTKERSRRYPAQTITDADYADDIALLANTPAQAKTLLHSLEREAAGIGLHVNAHKMEYMRFNKKGDSSTLNGSSLKLVDKFTSRGSSVSSIETDINTRLAKAWTAIDRLLVIWKSDLTDKIKRSFLPSGCVDANVWMHYMYAN